MNNELHDLETTLAKLRPAVPDAVFLDRLEAAADGSLFKLTAGEARLEAPLRQYTPSPLDADFFKSLESVVASTPFPVDDKILLFTQGGGSARRPVRTYRPMAAAAAVALLGGLTALLLPGGGNTPVTQRSVARIAPVTAGSQGMINAVNFSPAGYQRDIQDAADQGIVWKDNRPHRLMRVTYKDRASFSDGQGKKVELEQPQVEYILVPEKMD